MRILENHSLKDLNTFGINVNARFFVAIHSIAELEELFENPEFKNKKKLFLGGGSNVLLTRDFDGIVVLNNIKGIKILEENAEIALIRAMGGVVWHDLVEFAVERGFWGIENLALIPGSVGAAPMQNIGAYGAELKDVLVGIEAYDVETGDKRIFLPEECNFGYRDSIFKNELKDKYFILAITIRLSKTEKKNISYKVLKEYLDQNKIEIKGPKDISKAVSDIRRSKLPDPKVIGNAGSFFKNVFVEKSKFEGLLKLYPDMPHFEEPADVPAMAGKEEKIKIPAAWLIEQSGWKGKKVGNAGVHDKQALVLVNHGGATGSEIKNLAGQIIDSVFRKFGVTIEPEVNIIS